MRDIKLLMLCLIGALMLSGCNGSSSNNFSDNQGGNPQEQNQEQEQQEDNEAVNRVVSNLLAVTADGSPAIFNYAPVPASYGEGDYGAGTEEVNFVKYITSKDLDANGEFVKAINLEKDCGYIVKYSHSGRDLGYATLGLRITTPDDREMYLDFSGKGSSPETVSEEIYPETVKSIDELSEDVIAQMLAESGMTREELAEEIAFSNQSSDNTLEPLYVSASLYIVPEENPCAIFYTFKAPQTGLYQFAFSETEAGMPSSLDVPLEVRVYRSEESYSAGDDEEIKLTPRQMIHIQRLLLADATEFNDKGLPIAFKSDEDNAEGSGVRVSSAPPDVPEFIIDDTPDNVDEQEHLKIDAYVHNVPYDVNIFDDGAGFYAHNGMRSVIDSAIRDDEYSEIVIDNPAEVERHGTYGPNDGVGVYEKETFRADIIGTEEEHDRAMGVSSTNSVTLLSQALGFSGRPDDIALGVPSIRTVHVIFEHIENVPRPYNTPLRSEQAFQNVANFKLKDRALAILKSDNERFRRLFGDYFVAGYTWGMRFEAMINITALEQSQTAAQPYAEYMKAMFESCYKEDSSNMEALKNRILQAQQYGTISISIKNVNYSGKSSGGGAINLQGVLNDLTNFIRDARFRSSVGDTSLYNPLYVTLMRYREIPEARQYIDEKIPVGVDTYKNIRDLMLKVYRARCYYNSITLIPESHIRGRSLRNQTDLFESQVNEMLSKINRICDSSPSLEYYSGNFNIIANRYKTFLERYGFYRYFMMQQQDDTRSHGWSSSSGSGWEKWGFTTYDKSNVVQEDLNRDTYEYHQEHEEGVSSGPGYADFQRYYDPDVYNNSRIHWCILKYKANKSSCTNMQGKTIGKIGYHFYFKCGASRSMQVYFGYRLVQLPYDKYPFAGLEN